ncbi:uncharacterized protein FIBRA_04338 [Fibroporia radiculosa]|uniref:EKC/KEOPS complex subunit GON7 n=1 Tax=Fibroporia radiculosa TaxID=599839 RepID=J4GP31_9APHY|nr:uncharacterized protein FIBRA_04338 [Fibroporia radiculosa]CCM02255.1 predicted protein [Fibroporia radiculosa]
MLYVETGEPRIPSRLQPPADTPSPGLDTSKTHEFPLPAPSESGKEYYAALQSTIAQAKAILGEELTVWRDAVGKGEQAKECKVSTKAEDEEDEDESEAED